jgi:hypothetical protein
LSTRPYLKKPNTKWAGEGPEFKPQYHKKLNKMMTRVTLEKINKIERFLAKHKRKDPNKYNQRLKGRNYKCHQKNTKDHER